MLCGFAVELEEGDLQAAFDSLPEFIAAAQAEWASKRQFIETALHSAGNEYADASDLRNAFATLPDFIKHVDNKQRTRCAVLCRSH